MSDARPAFPLLHVGATSYESAGAVASWSASETPPEAAIAAAATEIEPAAVRLPGRRRAPRVRELLDQIARRHNEFWELLLGPYAKTGWVGSVFIHAAAITALSFLFIRPDVPAPPRILTGGMADVGPANVGAAVGDIELDLPAPVTLDSAAALLADGGSSGRELASLSAALGPATGSGQGSGSGAGDGIGAEIAGRVKAAGGQGGRLQVSLAWNDRSDLDLHLVTPDGERIYYAKPLLPGGGLLDVDMNVGGESARPVENITWADKLPPDGKFAIQVHFFRRHDGASGRPPFTIRLQLGDDVRLLSGQASVGRFTDVAVFTVADGRATSIQTLLTEQDESAVAGVTMDPKRAENRELAARELLDQARATPDPKVKAGRLRRIVDKFAGTESATTAQQLLDQLAL